MRRPFLANGDNFKHSRMKGNTRTNLSDTTFAEILLRGRVFKTSRSTFTVLVRVSNSDVVMPWVKKRPILNSLNNFFSSYRRTKVTGTTTETYQQSVFCGIRCWRNLTQCNFPRFRDHDHTAKLSASIWWGLSNTSWLWAGHWCPTSGSPSQQRHRAGVWPAGQPALPFSPAAASLPPGKS